MCIKINPMKPIVSSDNLIDFQARMDGIISTLMKKYNLNHIPNRQVHFDIINYRLQVLQKGIPIFDKLLYGEFVTLLEESFSSMNCLC